MSYLRVEKGERGEQGEKEEEGKDRRSCCEVRWAMGMWPGETSESGYSTGEVARPAVRKVE